MRRSPSSFSLFIISLLSLNSYFVVDAKPTINHYLPNRLYRDYGLSPVLDANIVRGNQYSTTDNAPIIIEKKFRFPVSVSEYETNSSVGTNARDLGHYAGYYKLNNTKGAKMFYYFFESTNNDKNAPVIVWLTGGPGCSSSIALFYENGPFRLTKNLSLVPNKLSWNKVSNLLYIDQPIGTGFSYTKHKADIRHTSEEAGVDFYNFIQAFIEKHPKYARNEFYITGESYAGHYIPAFATQIEKGNKENRGRTFINLKGMAIGNGWTNPKPQYTSYREYAKTMNLINQAQYDSLNDSVSTCVHDLKECDGKGSELSRCIFAINECRAILRAIIGFHANINYYDIRKNCTGGICYDFSDMERFLNKTSVKKALGVDERIPFVSCSDAVQEAMHGDITRDLSVYIPRLLDGGIKLLIYAGEYDLICNWIGNLMWVEDMKWSGQIGFKSARNVSFMVDGANAGQYKTYGNLTFLKVKDAGHMVPMDQPKASLEMLRRWTNGIPL